MDFWQQLMIVLRYIVVWGILSHVLGEALPRRWFHWDRFPYRAFSWEEEGRFYERLGIRKWKDLLPDKSKHTKKTLPKPWWATRTPPSSPAFCRRPAWRSWYTGV